MVIWLIQEMLLHIGDIQEDATRCRIEQRSARTMRTNMRNLVSNVMMDSPWMAFGVAFAYLIKLCIG
jgi:hypothetical protein